MELQQWFMNWKMWECLCNIYNICHHSHGENGVILNIFCGRQSSRWTPVLPLTVPWTFGGSKKKTCCCWSHFDICRKSDADHNDELPYRLQSCFIVVLVECLYIFCDVVIPKIMSLLFPIICRSSWMSLYQKDRGYSVYDAMNSLLSFMYFFSNGGVRDVARSVVTFFFFSFCGRKHILHILHFSFLSQCPKCNVLQLRYGRI